ncbi:MAG: hypothetical protein V4592_08090 [Bacteroidota bacterium]
MKTVFTWLYELLCGANDDLPEFRDTIFGSVGLASLLLALLLAALFYLLLGRWRHVWYKLSHWVVTLLVCLVAGFGLAFGIARQTLGIFNGYAMLFAVVNGIVLMSYFILFSLLFKRFSVYAKRTPF